MPAKLLRAGKRTTCRLIIWKAKLSLLFLGSILHRPIEQPTGWRLATRISAHRNSEGQMASVVYSLLIIVQIIVLLGALVVGLRYARKARAILADVASRQQLLAHNL